MARTERREPWRSLVLSLLCLSLASACTGTGAGGTQGATSPAELDGDVVAAWNEAVVAEIELNVISPPVAGRVLAHTTLAMHEALATGAEVPSYAGIVTDLPEPPGAEGEVWWPMVVASAAAETARSMLVSEDASGRIDALLQEQRATFSADVDEDVLDRSSTLGEEVGAGIVAWAEDDGYAAAGEVAFDEGGGPGDWVPTPPAFAPALEPAWGTLRPFVVAPGDCELRPPVPFSTEPGSPFHDEVLAVMEADAALDAEGEEIARFWNMEPNTGTPAGHWIRIVDTVSGDLDLDLVAAAEASAVVATTMHDAFIVGWEAKYDTDVVRPVTYVQEHVETGWLPYLVTPPFPEYPSGHSFVSGSAAAAATAQLGAQPFVDDSNHDGSSRSFDSFDAAALEAAESRLHGGVHYPMGIDAGIELGTCVGELAGERLEAAS